MAIVHKLAKGLFRIAYWCGLFAVFRRRKGLRILLYHGVTDRPLVGLRNAGGTHTLKQDFERQMAYLAKHHRVIPLNEAVDMIRQGKVFTNEVVVTFDDGYANNLSIALPILKKQGIKPAIFVTTGFIGTAKCLWTDEVEAIIDGLPKDVTIMVGGKPFVIRIQDTASMCDFKDALKTCRDSERHAALEQLRKHGRAKTNPDDKFLRWRDLKASDVTWCAHTRTHPILSKLGKIAAYREMRGSRDDLERHGVPTFAFAYPNGKKTDYTEETKTLVQKAGFTCALTTIPSIVEKDADLFELPRISMGEHPDFVSFLIRLYFPGWFF